MNITYLLSPIDPLLIITNGSTDFTSFVSYPGFNLNVTVATLDPDTGELLIFLDYYEHLQDEELTLQITPPDVPEAHSTPNYTFSWTVQTTNQLAVVAYSDEDYQQLEIIAKAANIIIYIYLTVFVVSLFLRKFIGLELAFLIQIGYLSLLTNKEITYYL